MDQRLDITAVLLVGGKGTRLRSVVTSTPKPLAAVGGQSFLELLVRQLRSQGVRRVVMCSGYLAEQIESTFGDGRAWGVEIQYSREDQPLGTGGAVKHAGRFLQAEPDFLVMNGDSFLEMGVREFVRSHRARKGFASMAVVPVENAARYGTVKVDSNGTVGGFAEKTGLESPGLINAGVYVFSRAVLGCIPEGPCSLERDVFPQILGRGIQAWEQRGMFIDIGTPEDYARAQELCEKLTKAASRK